LALWVIVPLTGLADPLLRTPTKLVILNTAGDRRRGRALGDTQTAIGVISLGAGIAAGAFWSGTGEMPFAVAGLVTFAAAAWSGAEQRRSRALRQAREPAGRTTRPEAR
jgi:hypothetical protein